MLDVFDLKKLICLPVSLLSPFGVDLVFHFTFLLCDCEDFICQPKKTFILKLVTKYGKTINCFTNSVIFSYLF